MLNELDKEKTISHKLYRQHTRSSNNVFIKDLSRIGRDLSKTIIIDNIKENFHLQAQNGIHIKHFLGDENDTELFDLKDDLIGNL